MISPLDRIGEPHVIEALRQAGGLVSVAAVKLGVAGQALQEYVDARPSFQAVLHQIKRETLDLAEAGLLKLIQDGDRQAILTYLQRVGKPRGPKYPLSFDELVD